MSIDRFAATIFLIFIALIVIIYFQNKDLVQSVFAHNDEHQLNSYEEQSDNDDHDNDHDDHGDHEGHLHIAPKPTDVFSIQKERLKAIRDYELMLKAEGIKKPLAKSKAPYNEELNQKSNKDDRVWLVPDVVELASAKVGDLLNIPLPKSSPRPSQEVIVRLTKKDRLFIANRQITTFKGYVANSDSQSKKVYISILGNSASIDIYDYDKIYSSSLTDKGGWLKNESKVFHNLNFTDDFIEVGKN